ncbi:MAG: RNA-guided pseudouridylation complex pseudouridine synthase subunit Cbf5 [Halobacteriales archaeon]
MAGRPPPDARNPEELADFGVIPLDKPSGPTSHQVSTWVRDLLDVDRAGHAGTLDPGVTGCLPVLTGDATRLAGALSAAPKAYVAVLEVHGPLPEGWEATVARFEGPIYQRPPRKSAVERTRRVREIHRLEVLERTERHVLLAVECEAGTYVRKLCHDLGLALGTGGHMADLRRTQTGPFDDGDLVTLHDVADGVADWRSNGRTDWYEDAVRPAEAALAHLPQVTIAPSAAAAVATGAPVYAPGVLEAPAGLDPDEAPLVACVEPDGAAVCLGRLVGDPGADRGVVVDLERVLVSDDG